MQKERVYWVDQAKALGLFVVMLVHGPIPYFMEYYLRSFSMPRFFIIAGLFVTLSQPLFQFLKSKFFRLMIPYFVFSMVSYIIWLGFREFSTSPDAQVSPLTALMWIFYGNGGGNMVHNRPLWFLPALFSTLMLVYLYSRIPKPYVYGVLILSSILGYCVMGAIQPRPPWSLDLALTTSVLVMIGYLFRDWFLDARPMRWGFLLLWTVVSLVTAFSNVYLRLSAADMGDYLLFYISAFTGSLVTIDVTKRLPYNRFLSFVGQHSLPIYAMHIVVFMFLLEFFDNLLPGLLELYDLTEAVAMNSVWFGFVRLAIFMVAGLGIPLLIMNLYGKVKAGLRPLIAIENEMPDMEALYRTPEQEKAGNYR